MMHTMNHERNVKYFLTESGKQLIEIIKKVTKKVADSFFCQETKKTNLLMLPSGMEHPHLIGSSDRRDFYSPPVAIRRYVKEKNM